MADRLDFEIDVELETGLITGHAGVPGLIEAFRQTGTAAVIDREVKLKSRRRGLSASAMVEIRLPPRRRRCWVWPKPIPNSSSTCNAAGQRRSRPSMSTPP